MVAGGEVMPLASMLGLSAGEIEVGSAEGEDVPCDRPAEKVAMSDNSVIDI